jgi:hypothetical protein
MRNLISKPTTRSNGSLLDRAREQSEAKFWKPAEPDTGIEGKVIRIIRDAGRYRATFYHIETEADGVQIVAGGESTVLGKKLNDLQIEVGDRIAILYLGEETSKAGQRFKKWSVVSEKADSPEAGGNPPGPADDEIPS